MSPAASSTSSSAESSRLSSGEKDLRDESLSHVLGSATSRRSVGQGPHPTLSPEGARAFRQSYPLRTILRTPVILAAAALLSFSLAACGGKKSTSDVAIATTAPSVQPTSSSAKPAVPAAAPTSAAPASTTAGNEPLSFSTADGVTIKGHLYSPAGAKRRALIIASSADQKTFGAYAGQFAAQGVAVYTFDQRGVGETGGAKNDAQMDKDLDVAVGLISSRDYPLVYVFGVGADPGDAAIKVAAREDLAGLATFSAGAAGKGDLAKVSVPKLLMAPNGNADAASLAQAASSARLVTVASNPPANDPLSAADARQALLDFVLGK